jgi:hypothetical protein
MISEMRLQRGKPIDIGICKVYPLTLDEIDELSEEVYYHYLSILLFDKDTSLSDNISPKDIEQISKMTNYEILCIQSLQDEALATSLITAFMIFLKENVIFNNGLFYLGKLDERRFITSSDFEKIQIILRKQNYLQEAKKKEFKPANDKAAEIMEKMRKAKEKIQQQQKDNQIGLSDIVSIVSTYSNDVNVLNVWNLTVYQLYMCYLRLILWDDYHNNFILLPHVDKKDSLNLKHWTTKLNNLTNN